MPLYTPTFTGSDGSLSGASGGTNDGSLSGNSSGGILGGLTSIFTEPNTYPNGNEDIIGLPDPDYMQIPKPLINDADAKQRQVVYILLIALLGTAFCTMLFLYFKK